ncbi:hypothetical protein D9M71_438330 [compost metagenome]
MLGAAAIDTYGLALVAQLTGVAGGARNVQVLGIVAEVLVAGEAHRQVAGVLSAGLLRRIDEKTKPPQVLWRGEALAGKGQLQGREPVVMQAFYLGALGCVVVRLAVGFAPLLQKMQASGGAVRRQVGPGHVIQGHGNGDQDQGCQHQHGTENDAQGEHPCRIEPLLCTSTS